jgi:hypothetical protein
VIISRSEETPARTIVRTDGKIFKTVAMGVRKIVRGAKMPGRRDDRTVEKILRDEAVPSLVRVKAMSVVRAEGNRAWTGNEVVKAEGNRVWTGNEVVVNVVGKAVAVKPRASGGN